MKKSLRIFGKDFNDVAGIKALGTDNSINKYFFDFDNKKHLNFYDYDGTLIDSFTTMEAFALTSLPSNPSHEGLTAQGWNWSLADIKSYLARYPDSDVNVGQMYSTDDGKTRIYITLDDPDNLFPYLSIGIDGAVNVDWGDGTESDTMTGGSITSLYNLQHVYSDVGDYIITIEVVNGSFSFYSSSSSYASILVGNIIGISSNRRCSRLYSSAITKILIGNDASIGDGAFRNCISLQSITIPDGITSIGGSAAFISCYSLRSITIPDSVTSISANAFNGCYLLQSIAIPDSVTSIANGGFYKCNSLQSITIPDGVTSIGTTAFYECFMLESITIPDGVTSIGNNVFDRCFSIKSIALPYGITSISDGMISAGRSLLSISIPDSVTSIGDSAFSNCNLLQSVTIPNGVTSISNSAFYQCTSLRSVTIPDSVTSIGNGAFNYCELLQSVTIPNGITSIGTNTFATCYSLQSVTIPDSVTSIGGSAFTNCSSLKSITIPDGVTSIGNSAFSYCYSLKSITIPDSITSIGSRVFHSCYGILEYHFKPIIPPTLSSTDTFTGIGSGTIIYVPYSADHSVLNAYKTAGYWSTYASYMQEEPAP